MPEASPTIEAAFLGVSALYLVYCAWRGWRRGIIRSGLMLSAMVIALLAGLAIGAAVATSTERSVPLPASLVALAVAVLVALPIYLVIRAVSALLFKRTDHQRSLPLKLFYGLGGAVIGVVLGYCVWWGVVSFIRASGAVKEGEFLAARSGSTRRQPSGFDRALLTLKNSIESGTSGMIVNRLDFIRPGTYQTLIKAGEVMASPQALHRLLQYPAISEVVADPQIAEAIADPEVQEAVLAGDWLAVVRNRRLLQALNNPDLIAKVEKIHIEAALDFALLRTPRATP